MTPVCHCPAPIVVRGETDTLANGREYVKSDYCRRCGCYWAPQYGSQPDPALRGAKEESNG